MRKNNISFRIFATLLFVVLIVASITQAVIKTNVNDKKNILNNRDEVGLLSTNIWEDTFNNETKIDPNPPGVGQSDDYVVSNGQVSMANTYAVWTDPAWTKMKPITITNGAGQILSNNVIYFAIPYVSGMQSQYQDIRFKHQNNPTTWLNYWIERYNATTAHVWVKVPSIPMGTSTMYLFYGNPSATSQSNYLGVFSWSAKWTDDEKTSNHADNEGTWDPDVCFGNGEFFTAWEEGQPYWLFHTLGYKQEIRASIYDSNGNKLVDDKQVFNDGTLFYRNENPSIDYGGGKFFVAWEHYAATANPSITTEDIKARTVVRNGDQLQLGTVIDVSSATDCQADANVQYDSVNNRFCVVWEDAQNGQTNYNVYGRLYDTNGNPVGSEKGIATATYSQCEPSIAFDPIHEQYMIVWEEGITANNGPFSIKGGIFDENLNQIGSTVTIVIGSDSVDYNFPCVEFCPGTQRFLVTWNNDDISTGDWWGNIWGKIFDPSGNVVVNTFEIKSGEYVRTDIVPYFSSSFFISFNSKGTSGSGLIWGKMISSNGTIFGGDIQLSASSSALADWANLAVGNGKIFTAWEDIRIDYPSPWNDMPDVYANMWWLQMAGSSVTYSVGTEKQIVLTAHITSVKIIPTNYNKWDVFNATYTEGTITFDILDGTTGALLLLGVLPGWNLYSHGITAPTIRLKATFMRANPSTTPRLDKWSVKWELNQPPNSPSSPSPANGSTEVSITTDISWTGGDPNGDSVTYDVFFGPTSSPPKIISNQSSTSYDTGTMNYGTTYYWKIVAWDNHSAITIGPLWHFTTHNDPPNTPGSPNPANGTTGVSINADLSWTGGDVNPGDAVTYDVYFGTIIPPTIKVSANQSGVSYDPVTMNYNVHYYWKIVAWDNHGASTAGPIWDFTTENRAPYAPSSPSPANHQINVSIIADLSWTGGDPDPGDIVTYDVYFGTTTPPTIKVSVNQSGISYDPGTMSYNAKYYWKIVAWDNHGASTAGLIWDFTICINGPPYIPSSPDPANDAIDVAVTSDLYWIGGDPNPGDIVTYDVYFGITSPPPSVAYGQSATTYDPGTMLSLTTYYWKIVAWDNHGASTEGPMWHFTTVYVPNNPPYTPYDPIPSNHATDVNINTDVSWAGGDPDPYDTVTYDVYFGTISPPQKVFSNQSVTSYDPGILNHGTTYYWRIVAWDNHGASTSGSIWDFTTHNDPPNTPSNPNPANHAIGVSVNVDLSWTGGDPNPGDIVTYDVYFGTITPPTIKVSANQSGVSYDPGTMSYNAKYYWKIVAWDNHGASAAGPIWDFTTINRAPYTPSSPNPTDHQMNVSLVADVSWTGGDPDPGDIVTYDVYFGITSPPPLVVSGQSATTYDPGTMLSLTTYYWKIVAWDNHGASTESPIWYFTTVYIPNNSPYTPYNPIPSNHATDVNINIDVSWAGGDPDPGDIVTYDVYFGITSPPPLVVSGQSATTYDPGTMYSSTIYYWKIVAHDNHGGSTEGPIWQFTTKAEPNNPPYTPHDPSPANGATSVDIDTDLSWTGGDPDAGDTATYDVYFGTASPPPKLVNNQTSPSYQPALLNGNMTYYWKIVAWDTHGASTAGPIWSFTTKSLNDTTLPIVNIINPEKAIYFRNNKIIPFITTLVFFAIDIDVAASDNDSGIAKVEFYIDDQYKANDSSAPYSWTWSDKSFFFYTLKVIAYDNAGNRADKKINVWKFF